MQTQATENVSVGDVGLGRFRGTDQPAPGAPDGELQLDRPPPLHAALLLRHVVLARQQIGAGQTELTFEVEPASFTRRLGTVALRLIDGATGEPIAGGASVSLQSAQGGGSRAQPDGEGRVVASSIPPGLVSLQITGTGRESWWDLVRVPAGGTVELGDVFLHAPVEIKGKLLDEAGAPVSGSVQWTNLATMTYPRELIDRRSTLADGDGDFTIWGAGPHRYVVIARARDGRIGTATVDARSGTAPPVEIRMADAVAIIVSLAEDDELTGYTLTVRDSEGVPVAARRIEARWREASLAVAPGDYTFEVHGDGGELLKTVALKARGEQLHVVVP